MASNEKIGGKKKSLLYVDMQTLLIFPHNMLIGNYNQVKGIVFHMMFALLMPSKQKSFKITNRNYSNFRDQTKAY